MRTLDIATPDGRSLEVLVTPAEGGFPLVFHHGTPQGAVPYGLLQRPAAERGLAVISYSRPGYGRSSPRLDGSTTATVADDAGDVAVILDHLGLSEFITLGWSGGGPRALACAAMLPERCRGAVCGVGIAPAAEYEGDFTQGMAEENIAEYAAAFTGVEALQTFLESIASGMSQITGEQIAEAMRGLLPPVDKEALTGELADYLAASMHKGLEQGVIGWRDDDLTHTRPWGFKVGQISVPVAIWQGSEDLMVPFAHAQWLARNVSNARAHLVQGQGHVSLLMQMNRILDDLLEMAGMA